MPQVLKTAIVRTNGLYNDAKEGWVLLKDGAALVCLIKPQFEAGREEVGKKGVVREKAVHREVIETVLSFARETGWSVLGLDFSPIRGPEGNIEFICYLKNGAFEAPEIDVSSVVEAAHAAFERTQP